ncbi:MAG: YiiX/YebB-like N1pC/P60 family cysteine hydrolase [Alphaproteobacteria bacterium]
MPSQIQNTLLDRIGRWLAKWLQREIGAAQDYGSCDPEMLRRVLEPGDVILIEGQQRISTAIKYLTQSTWSHVVFYVGADLDPSTGGHEERCLIEVSIEKGCVAVPLSKYANSNIRICRPVGLAPTDIKALVDFMVGAIGRAYDLKNIFDLARYLIPNPPVPMRFRRRMIALGSGDPTRAICSTLIAEAFQSVRYPILPLVDVDDDHAPLPSGYTKNDILHIRHHSLFTPRDFDLSPYFAIIKPTIQSGFEYRDLVWAKKSQPQEPPQ